MFPSFQLDIKDVSSVSAISIKTLTSYQYNMSTKLPFKAQQWQFSQPMLSFPRNAGCFWQNLAKFLVQQHWHKFCYTDGWYRLASLLDISCSAWEFQHVRNTSKVTWRSTYLHIQDFLQPTPVPVLRICWNCFREILKVSTNELKIVT